MKITLTFTTKLRTRYSLDLEDVDFDVNALRPAVPHKDG